jgi:AcrR family transcriptional regulator
VKRTDDHIMVTLFFHCNGVTILSMESSSPYVRALRQGQEALRRAFLDAASGLLVEEGPQALTMRRVASAVGCSTTVLYTMFGGKEGLADALYREGFERLTRHLEEAEKAHDAPEDPVTRAAALAIAYRESALADRNYYGVMFGRAIPGFEPSQESLAVADASLGMLADAVQEGMDSGVLVEGDARAVAEVLWAAAHGVVSLELAGHFTPEVATEHYRTLCWAAMAPFLVERESGRS